MRQQCTLNWQRLNKLTALGLVAEAICDYKDVASALLPGSSGNGRLGRHRLLPCSRSHAPPWPNEHNAQILSNILKC
eukprot:2338936-Pleurochrysis_carterae.AAC.1